jgi:hypothetical protein
LQAVEEGVGSFGVDEVAGEGVDDLGEGELHGEPVFQGRQADDVAAVQKVPLGDHGGAVEGMAFVEPLVEVAKVEVGEGDGVALEAIGLDVTTKIGLHDFLLWVPPPGEGFR